MMSNGTIAGFLAERALPAVVSNQQPSAPARVPLDYPLPEREWFRTEGGWASRPWTAAARKAADTTKETRK